MDGASIIERQLEFYRRGKAGCLFAAHVASNPMSFGWKIDICTLNPLLVEELISVAIAEKKVTTQSLIFPQVTELTSIEPLFECLANVPQVGSEQDIYFDGCRCIGIRVQIGQGWSWVSGFGPFRFLPTTRQAPFTEIVFRSKSRPEYSRVMKPAPPDTLHLADMDLNGMEKAKFELLWDGSLQNTMKVLGHPPDIRSAAKTTFAVPLGLDINPRE